MCAYSFRTHQFICYTNAIRNLRNSERVDQIVSFIEYLTRESKESDREINLCIACVSEEIDFKKIGRQLGSDRTQNC